MAAPAVDHRRSGALREVALTLGAAAGVLCLLAAVASVGFGVKPLIFRSGSMSPTIETGALALARTTPEAEVSEGDVVSVVNARGVRITHRVQSVDHAAGSATLILRGDDNQTADAEPYPVTTVDRVFFHVNKLGYVVDALTGPVGVFAGGMLAGALLMFAFGRRGGAPAPDPPGKPHQKAPTTLGATVVVLAVAAVLSSSPAVRPYLDTDAAWLDTADARGGTFSTLDRVAAPVLGCGLLSLHNVRVSWTPVAEATSYRLTVTPTGQDPQLIPLPAGTLGYTIGSILGSGTASVQSVVGYPATPWYSAPSNQIRYTTIAVGTCNLL